MKPVQIEFLMVDHLSARLDKAVGKIERMSQQASSANRPGNLTGAVPC